ncbi:c-type cytochrome [Altererythrobacter salegens]|uniref:C-type cytochrome n=1 Tax=Croceibacterium salegens TaxID=1737568 RepID=A0A6I4SY82_9SPHN|nr:cytochrome c family protein [Croceibacterium salegens]MXO59816.1 c-type cytochrome [Croceibacterium salegens]
MTDRFNTIAGWVLFSGIVALGFGSLSSHIFHADSHEGPEVAGYPVEAPEEGAGGGSGPDLGTLLAAADPAAGEKVFAKCTSCHTINQGGANGIGPNLYGTIGEPIAKGKGGFAFSSSLADIGGTWTYENLDHWLASPKAMASGTKMSFAGLSKPEDRANVIAYLKANGGGPDYPAPAAAAPAEEAPADAAEGEAAPADAAAEAPAEAAAG